jgi:hypothetical protein
MRPHPLLARAQRRAHLGGGRRPHRLLGVGEELLAEAEGFEVRLGRGVGPVEFGQTLLERAQGGDRRLRGRTLPTRRRLEDGARPLAAHRHFHLARVARPRAPHHDLARGGRDEDDEAGRESGRNPRGLVAVGAQPEPDE